MASVQTSSLPSLDLEAIRGFQLVSGSSAPLQVSAFTKLNGGNIEFAVPVAMQHGLEHEHQQ
jgi:hypothetical protein